MKVVKWSPKKTREILGMRLRDAKKYRREKVEHQWKENEATIYHSVGILESQNFGANISINDLASFLDQPDSKGVGVNYAFKHYRFIHAQMSANPPSVLSRPTSSDPSDKRRADAADRLCRHAIRGYKMQEVMDQSTSKTLLYGTGWIKTEHDENLGDIAGRDEDGNIIMEGDIKICSPSTWDVWVDPHARDWASVKWIIERQWLTHEDAESMFPEAADILNKVMEEIEERTGRYADDKRQGLEEKQIPIYFYYETGLPSNGMLGRYAPFLEDGTPLDDVGPNPFRFHPTPEDDEEVAKIMAQDAGEIVKNEDGSLYERGPETAYLPFHLLTDIDVADQVYGKSFVEYEVPIQDTLNRLDTVVLDNIQANGATKMVLPEGCEVADDQPSNTPWDIIKTTGNQKPSYVGAPQPMPDIGSLRDRLQAGGDDVAGVNDAMFGKQQREQSGFSMQYATNQGNMIRRRLFNKYVLFVESVYKAYLSLIQRHWTTSRTIKVLGREKAYEAIDIKGSDIISGFDLVVEYGASLSLDPTSRREEIMALMPIFEKYGVDGKSILSMLKLNELEGMYDIVELAAMRQQEIFEHIIEGKGEVYVAPREMQEHDGMLAYCYKFVMTSEYRDLNPKVRTLIDRHIKDREALKAGKLSAGTPQDVLAQPPGPAGMPGEMPAEGALGMAEMGAGAPLPSLGSM